MRLYTTQGGEPNGDLPGRSEYAASADRRAVRQRLVVRPRLSKSGKTTGALSAAKADGVLCLNFDQRNSTFYARRHFDPDGRIREPEMPPYEQGKQSTEMLLNEVAVMYSQAAMSGQRPIWPTVVADPIGQLHRRLLDDVSKRALKPSLDAYLDVTTIISRWCKFMCDMPCNLILVCHERPVKDEVEGGFVRLPFTGTTNPDLGQRLVEMVDVVAYCGRKETPEGPRYVAQLYNGNGRQGGDRFGVLGDFREIDLAEWFQAIGNPSTTQQEEAA